MSVEELLNKYGKLPQVKALAKLLRDTTKSDVSLNGLVGSAAPMAFASALSSTKLKDSDDAPSTILFILHDADEAGYFYHDMSKLLPADSVLFFPSSYRRAVKYGQRDSANEILRTEVLSKISKDSSTSFPSSVITHPEALSELVITKKRLDEKIIRIATGDTIDVTDFVHKLREYGFKEEDYVYEPGQFAQRGSIIDVFSYSSELPFRIDFFGDEIDTIRTFSVEDQLSKEKKQSVEIVPELASFIEDKTSFLRFLPDDTIVVTRDFRYINDVVSRIYNEGFSGQALEDRLSSATEVEQEQIKEQMRRESQLCLPSDFNEDLARFRRFVFSASDSNPHFEAKSTIRFNTIAQPLFHKNIELLCETLDDYTQKGYQLFILADSQKQQQRLKDILAEHKSTLISHPSALVQVNSTLHEGFIDNDLCACFLTDHQIFDRFHRYSLKSERARSGKMALTMKELQEMEIGDYLVHVDYGIGKFGGLVRIPIAGNSTTNADGHQAYQEVIRIVYQHNDKVDVSIHSLYKISKYRRSDTGEPPRLSILGSGAWERLKERTKKRIKDIARDLIKLYAKRMSEKGFSFSADSFMQQELEASFLYEDTPDQLKATQEVKADMESSRPMDRLVCGDVGFGKTEVAIRAAFKAACDSKQVAVLVPTTVLAFQHYQTFKSRLEGLPVRVDYLSRARSAKQVKLILEDLKDGKIDILVGTHKLIGKTVKWKDLGLLIIDEEQKFGVSVKEKLRTLKSNVDTLTMSATPIPRTLQFSLMGARDMSIIRTPPPNRHPIYTEVATLSAELLTDAINFEMSRSGQVYFVNDRISKLEELERLIKKHIPDCRVAIGHGQMRPEQLEDIIMGFINYDYDVLLSTTIIENGIDIPNANTIIINDAHRFGLSDLHQMRGRVGRSNKKAFCYLLAPPKAYLPSEARRRLEALETFSELGSGFSIAMQDLDIRGAGNLLGAEQSGFMEDLGYETYLKVVKQAMAELANEQQIEPTPSPSQREWGKETSAIHTPLPLGGGGGGLFVADCTVESDLEMYFPDTYVPGQSERMLLYRELDNIEDDRTLETYRQRLIDRFGAIPHEGEELMQVVSLRKLGKSLGCEKLILRQGKLILQFVSNIESPYYQSPTFGKVINYAGSHIRECQLKEIKGRRLMHVFNVPTVGKAVETLREIEQNK